MAKQSVLIHGATGETGSDIVTALIEDGGFEIAALVRPQSAEKQDVKELSPRGVKVVIGDVNALKIDDLANLIRGYDTVISTVGADAQLDQLALVDAAAKAGTKRFVPCGFTTISPPGGVMDLRDKKEKVHERIWYHHLPYTIVDVGFWHQISFPELPSGRVDYAMMKLVPLNIVFGDGTAPNLLTDKRDIGRFVARIIKDDRTLNQRVFTRSDVLSQNEIWEILEKKSGEKIETTYQSHEEVLKELAEAEAAYAANPSDSPAWYKLVGIQYKVSKYVRKDNTPENAKYLGYIDAMELYPDFKPITFAEFVDELLSGKAKPLYPTRYQHLKKSS